MNTFLVAILLLACVICNATPNTKVFVTKSQICFKDLSSTSPIEPGLITINTGNDVLFFSTDTHRNDVDERHEGDSSQKSTTSNTILPDEWTLSSSTKSEANNNSGSTQWWNTQKRSAINTWKAVATGKPAKTTIDRLCVALEGVMQCGLGPYSLTIGGSIRFDAQRVRCSGDVMTVQTAGMMNDKLSISFPSLLEADQPAVPVRLEVPHVQSYPSVSDSKIPFAEPIFTKTNGITDIDFSVNGTHYVVEANVIVNVTLPTLIIKGLLHSVDDSALGFMHFTFKKDAEPTTIPLLIKKFAWLSKEEAKKLEAGGSSNNGQEEVKFAATAAEAAEKSKDESNKKSSEKKQKQQQHQAGKKFVTTYADEAAVSIADFACEGGYYTSISDDVFPPSIVSEYNSWSNDPPAEFPAGLTSTFDDVFVIDPPYGSSNTAPMSADVCFLRTLDIISTATNPQSSEFRTTLGAWMPTDPTLDWLGAVILPDGTRKNFDMLPHGVTCTQPVLEIGLRFITQRKEVADPDRFYSAFLDRSAGFPDACRIMTDVYLPTFTPRADASPVKLILKQNAVGSVDIQAHYVVNVQRTKCPAGTRLCFEYGLCVANCNTDCNGATDATTIRCSMVGSLAWVNEPTVLSISNTPTPSVTLKATINMFGYILCRATPTTPPVDRGASDFRYFDVDDFVGACRDVGASFECAVTIDGLMANMQYYARCSIMNPGIGKFFDANGGTRPELSLAFTTCQAGENFCPFSETCIAAGSGCTGCTALAFPVNQVCQTTADVTPPNWLGDPVEVPSATTPTSTAVRAKLDEPGTLRCKFLEPDAAEPDDATFGVNDPSVFCPQSGVFCQLDVDDLETQLYSVFCAIEDTSGNRQDDVRPDAANRLLISLCPQFTCTPTPTATDTQKTVTTTVTSSPATVTRTETVTHRTATATDTQKTVTTTVTAETRTETETATRRTATNTETQKTVTDTVTAETRTETQTATRRTATNTETGKTATRTETVTVATPTGTPLPTHTTTRTRTRTDTETVRRPICPSSRVVSVTITVNIPNAAALGIEDATPVLAITHSQPFINLHDYDPLQFTDVLSSLYSSGLQSRNIIRQAFVSQADPALSVAIATRSPSGTSYTVTLAVAVDVERPYLSIFIPVFPSTDLALAWLNFPICNGNQEFADLTGISADLRLYDLGLIDGSLLGDASQNSPNTPSPVTAEITLVGATVYGTVVPSFPTPAQLAEPPTAADSSVVCFPTTVSSTSEPSYCFVYISNAVGFTTANYDVKVTSSITTSTILELQSNQFAIFGGSAVLTFTVTDGNGQTLFTLPTVQRTVDANLPNCETVPVIGEEFTQCGGGATPIAGVCECPGEMETCEDGFCTTVQIDCSTDGTSFEQRVLLNCNNLSNNFALRAFTVTATNQLLGDNVDVVSTAVLNLLNGMRANTVNFQFGTIVSACGDIIIIVGASFTSSTLFQSLPGCDDELFIGQGQAGSFITIADGVTVIFAMRTTIDVLDFEAGSGAVMTVLEDTLMQPSPQCAVANCAGERPVVFVVALVRIDTPSGVSTAILAAVILTRDQTPEVNNAITKHAALASPPKLTGCGPIGPVTATTGTTVELLLNCGIPRRFQSLTMQQGSTLAIVIQSFATAQVVIIDTTLNIANGVLLDVTLTELPPAEVQVFSFQNLVGNPTLSDTIRVLAQNFVVRLEFRDDETAWLVFTQQANNNPRPTPNPPAPTPITPVNTTPTPASDDDDSNLGWIAAPVVGGVCLCCIIVAILILISRRNKKDGSKMMMEPYEIQYGNHLVMPPPPSPAYFGTPYAV